MTLFDASDSFSNNTTTCNGDANSQCMFSSNPFRAITLLSVITVKSTTTHATEAKHKLEPNRQCAWIPVPRNGLEESLTAPLAKDI